MKLNSRRPPARADLPAASHHNSRGHLCFLCHFHPFSAPSVRPRAHQPFSKTHGTAHRSAKCIASCESALERGTTVPAPCCCPASLVWWQEEGQLSPCHTAQGGPRETPRGCSQPNLSLSIRLLTPRTAVSHADVRLPPTPLCLSPGAPQGEPSL